MDREILFKGFHECETGTHKAYYNGKWHTGKWVYGYYGRKGANRTSYKHYICKPVFNSGGFAYNAIFYFEDIEVAPETVSQYTEVCDESQAKIFENDIVLEIDTDGSIYSEICYTVVFIHGCFKLKEIGNRVYRDFYLPQGKTRKVIGNKFSNPEYLEGAANG